MRRCAGVILSLLLICLSLGGCKPVVDTPRDEIRLYRWYSESENGNNVSLRFSDNNAAFTVENPDHRLCISGLCEITDTTLLIFDRDSGMNYTFTYSLEGDSVTLGYDGGELTLKKLPG